MLAVPAFIFGTVMLYVVLCVVFGAKNIIGLTVLIWLFITIMDFLFG